MIFVLLYKLNQYSLVRDNVKKYYVVFKSKHMNSVYPTEARPAQKLEINDTTLIHIIASSQKYEKNRNVKNKNKRINTRRISRNIFQQTNLKSRKTNTKHKIINGVSFI